MPETTTKTRAAIAADIEFEYPAKAGELKTISLITEGAIRTIYHCKEEIGLSTFSMFIIDHELGGAGAVIRIAVSADSKEAVWSGFGTVVCIMLEILKSRRCELLEAHAFKVEDDARRVDLTLAVVINSRAKIKTLPNGQCSKLSALIEEAWKHVELAPVEKGGAFPSDSHGHN